MNAEILAVGTELLMGQIANTNAQYISGKLADLGVNVYFHSVVGDNPKRLKQSLLRSLKRSDVVIMTGGLGPTKDDLTKETVAEVFNKKLVLHQESFEKLKGFFQKINRDMTKNNIKQAYMPEDSIVLANERGTAPGCIIEKDKKIIVMLPGPPSEMKPMFNNSVVPFLKNKSNIRLLSKYIRIFGVGESLLEDRLSDLIEKQENPTIAPYAKEGQVTLRITAGYKEGEDVEDIFAPVISEIESRIGDCIYSTCDEELHEVAASLLIENDITISFAESCTGGLVSSKLSEVPGISKVFDRSVVSYSNQSKMENLNVKNYTLMKYGAVSKETAIEMSEGIREISGTDIGVSITGIAGPGGGTEEKPVGLVYIGLSHENGSEYKELKLWGDRNRIRNVTSLYAFDMIRRYVLYGKV